MKINTNTGKIKEVLSKGVEEVFPDKLSLGKRMESGKRLKLYCGYDPSAPTLHIGHLITLRKLAQFQSLGHEVIMLIGDFTGMIGDPTDKLATRKKLSRQEVLKNSQNYKKLASKIIQFTGKNPAKILYNSQWSDKLSFADLIELSSNFTVQQMIVRDMFQQRIKDKKPIYLHEFLYPLAQAYDSFAMDVDLEIGGKDQTFNMLCGRDLMKVLKKKEKFVLSVKLLTDPSGKKMGKSEGNTINLDDEPKEIYGKVMSWPDEMVPLAFELITDVSLEEIKEIANQVKKGGIGSKESKASLAREIVASLYNEKQAKEAEKEFNQVFKEKGLPTEMPEIKIKEERLNILDFLAKTKLVSSKSEAKRLISQRGVKINGKIEENWRKTVKTEKGTIVQVGKRKFVKIS